MSAAAAVPRDGATVALPTPVTTAQCIEVVRAGVEGTSPEMRTAWSRCNGW